MAVGHHRHGFTMADRALSLSAMPQKMTTELTILSRQWSATQVIPEFAVWMASSEVDKKFLGHFAKLTSQENPYLSSMLYKMLGLSIILSKKLMRAQKLRRLDPTRGTRSVQQLYHHVLWLAREGLVMTEQYILPMVGKHVELKVLAHKLRGSFYHLFVLFCNKPSINQAAGPSALFPEPLSPPERTTESLNAIQTPVVDSPTRQLSPVTEANLAGGCPPGFPPLPPVTSNSASFILPSTDYLPITTSCFTIASDLAQKMLPGSHPLRLSVKLEQVAFWYDCLHEADESRQLARQAIADVYEAQEGMDDESFEDAAEMVSILDKMTGRPSDGRADSSMPQVTFAAGGATNPTIYSGRRAPEEESSRYSTARIASTWRTDRMPAAVPSPGMTNPI